MSDLRTCSRCGELLPLTAFYFISKRTGKLRGQCKDCMREIKVAQRDPDWLPVCARCGETRPRSGPGRRLCALCFEAVYDEEERNNGSHRLKLKPCRQCGTKRLRADHLSGTMLCPICRSVGQSRRKRLKEFNLTPPEYLALLDYQRHVCAICKRKPRSGLTLHIDHRHPEPRIVRGAICNSCNTLIGLANERRDLLENAIAYLESPPAQELYPGREARVEANRAGVSWNRLTRVAT